jgi:hypothetical protein
VPFTICVSVPPTGCAAVASDGVIDSAALTCCAL